MEDLKKKVDDTVEEELILDDNELEEVAGGKFVVKKQPANTK